MLNALKTELTLYVTRS